MEAVKARPLSLGKATREAFGETLRELGGEDPALVVLDGDVSNSTRTEFFAHAYPERFFNVGIAESNLVSVAAGMARCGKHPWISSFAAFLMGNGFDQLRMSVAFPHLNVKAVGTHAGISIGEDGPSQMGIEDVALACALPGFQVFVPADEAETRAVVRVVADTEEPTYIRCGRQKVPRVYEGECPFKIGKAITVREGSDITLAANGLMLSAALEAAESLFDAGISARVLDMVSVKPIDEEALEEAARETGALVVAEEHLAHGGLGSIVAMVLARRCPAPIAFVNLGDTYAQSGKSQELLAKYNLTADEIHRQAHLVLERKR